MKHPKLAYPQPAPYPARDPDSEAEDHWFTFEDAHPSEQQYGSIILTISKGNGGHKVALTRRDLDRLLTALVDERHIQFLKGGSR
jgi:hypothetical protein